MKKFRILALVGALFLVLSACGNREPVPETTEEAQMDGVTITYYHGNERGSQLVEETTLIPKLTAQALLDLLTEQKVIPENTTVRNFKLTGGIITLDLSREFEEGVRDLSRGKEEVVMGSLVNTFLKTYEAEGLDLTTEGRILKTRYHIYDSLLTVYH